MMIDGDNYGSYRHALAGVSDYDWKSLPPLTEQQKQDVASIADGFKTKEDVAKWAAEYTASKKPALGSPESIFFMAVLGAADQKKLVDLSASLGVKSMLRSQNIMVSESDVEKAVIPGIIAEADGYAASLIKAGALTQADYDSQKATAKGTDWTVSSAMAFRDGVHKALDDFNAKQPKAKEGGASGWLLPVGIAAAAFFALRK